MSVSSLISSIRKPVISNKKLFGLITFAIVVIGVMGAGYYFYIQNNQSYVRDYKLKTLDSYYQQISKKLDNDFLRALSRKGQNKTDNKENASVVLDSLDEKSIYRKAGSTVILKNDFDEFILRVIYNEKPLRPKSSYSLPNTIIPDSIYKSDPLNLGTVADLDVMGEEYKLFARRYQYNDNVEIQMIGLIEGDHYNKLTRELDPWIIALLATFLLLCLFGMPFLKVLFIAEDEKLSRTDIIIAGFAVLIGSPLILAVFLSMMSYLHEYYINTPKQLKHIGKQIERNFINENALAIENLKDINLATYDSLNILKRDSVVQFFETIDKDFRLLESFKYITKLDTLGNTLYHLNFLKKPPIDSVPRNLAGRIYFKDFVASNDIWYTPGGTEYVMRPVVSIEDASEEAVYMVQDTTTAGIHYKIGSSQLMSVHNAILPFGFDFAIIDELGDVWFHSEPSKATLENFFVLSRDNNELIAAVLGRVDATGQFDYHGQKKRYQVYPIAGTNLSVVTFYDIALIRLKISEVLSITSIAIFWALLFSAIICLLTVILRTGKKGLYTYQDFLFDFLLPKKRNQNKYILLSITFTLFLFITILVTIVFSFPPSSAFLASLLFIIWSYSMVYYLLHTKNNGKSKGFSIRIIFLIVGIIFLNIFLWEEGSQNLKLFLLVLFLQLVCLLFFIKPLWSKQKRALVKNINSVKRYVKLPYQKWYAIFLFSWLLLSAILPTIIFYTKAEKMEEMIWVKMSQFYMIKNYLEKEKSLENSLSPIEYEEEEVGKAYMEEKAEAYKVLHRNHLQNGLYISNEDSLYKSFRKGAPEYEANKFRQLLWASRPIYNEKIRPYQAMVYKGAYDNSWQSEEKIGGINLELSNPGIRESVVKSEHSGLTSQTNEYNYDQEKEVNTFLIIFTWIGCGIILAILFTLILFYLDRFFGFRFNQLKPNDFDIDKEYLLKFTEVLQRSDTNFGLLLIGLPFSGKSRFAQEIVDESTFTHCVVLSFLQLDQLNPGTSIEDCYKDLSVEQPDENLTCSQWEESIQVFILEHLEHDVNSFESNRIKLRLICHLMAKKKRIILTSEIYPSQILAFYQDQIEVTENKKAEMISDFYSWRNILSAFPQILIGITNTRAQVNNKLNSLSTDDEELEMRKIITKELGFSNFLPTLAPVIYAKSKFLDSESQLDFQRMVVHIQNLSHGYYTDIWNSMPSRERYMVYDLAKDGFLNIKNENSLFTLMKKGLIVWNDKPEIFNNSFRNFIVSSVSSAEALQLEMKNRGQGSWGTIRIVLYLVICAVVIFILLGEPDLVKDFETLIGALGGIGVLIPVISSILARSGQK